MLIILQRYKGKQKMKQIIIGKGELSILMNSFKVSNVSVWRALRYHNNSDLSKRIRRLALMRGGQMVGEDIKISTCFDSNGNMTQIIGNRVRIEVNKSIEEINVYVDGRIVEKHGSLSVSEYVRLQERMKSLAFDN